MIFKIVDRKISVESEVVLSYSLDYVATFEFDEEWNNKIVTARFVHENGNMVEVVLDSENSCNIPLFPKGIVNVGVYTDEFTSTYAPMRIYTSIKDIGEHEVIPPTADVYQQIISLIEEGRIKGEDGFSPTVVIEDIEGGHTVVITDVEGDKEFDVMDGSDYTITEADYQAIADRVPQPDLSDYVRNTDYASVGVAGVVKGADYTAFTTNADGNALATIKSYDAYNSGSDRMFIGKGTLENVLNERLKEPDYTIIAEGTLTEAINPLEISVPNMFNYREMSVQMVLPILTTRQTLQFFLKGGVMETMLDYISNAGSTTFFHSIRQDILLNKNTAISSEVCKGYRVTSDQSSPRIGMHNGNTSRMALYNFPLSNDLDTYDTIKITRANEPLPIGTQYRVLVRG